MALTDENTADSVRDGVRGMFYVGDWVCCPEIDYVPGEVIGVNHSSVVVQWRDSGITNVRAPWRLIHYDPDRKRYAK